MQWRSEAEVQTITVGAKLVQTQQQEPSAADNSRRYQGTRNRRKKQRRFLYKLAVVQVEHPRREHPWSNPPPQGIPAKFTQSTGPSHSFTVAYASSALVLNSGCEALIRAVTLMYCSGNGSLDHAVSAS